MSLRFKINLIVGLLTVLFVAAAYSGVSQAYTVAALLFGVASLTDYLDGWIARRRGLVTSFGQLMDPLADKVLMSAAFIVLLDMTAAPCPRGSLSLC